MNPGCASLFIRLSPADCNIAAEVVPDGQVTEPAAVAKDAFCAKELMKMHAPKAAISIFDSARTPKDQESYKITREFAFKWSQKHGEQYPVLTGGGRGIMEAGNRGAFEDQTKSLSIGTFFTDEFQFSNTEWGYYPRPQTDRPDAGFPNGFGGKTEPSPPADTDAPTRSADDPAPVSRKENSVKKTAVDKL